MKNNECPYSLGKPTNLKPKRKGAASQKCLFYTSNLIWKSPLKNVQCNDLLFLEQVLVLVSTIRLLQWSTRTPKWLSGPPTRSQSTKTTPTSRNCFFDFFRREKRFFLFWFSPNRSSQWRCVGRQAHSARHTWSVHGRIAAAFSRSHRRRRHSAQHHRAVRNRRVLFVVGNF